MNAVAPITQAPKAPLVIGGSVRAIIPGDFEGVWRFAQVVLASGMAPRDMRTIEQIAVAIMHGMEVGLTPLAALQSIAMINGRPSVWGDGALGLVRGSGLLEWIHEDLKGDGDGRVAICELKRKGEPKLARRFSVEDAKTAGLWTKRGSNGQPTPWQTYPARMLAMRARAWALRDGFADVLRGLHIAEEVQDIPDGRTMAQARVISDEPPAPPAITSQQAIDAEPPSMDDPPADGPSKAEEDDPTVDVERWFSDIDGQMAACQDMVTLGEVYVTQVEPYMARLMPPDAEHVDGMLRRHQRRLGG